VDKREHVCAVLAFLMVFMGIGLLAAACGSAISHGAHPAPEAVRRKLARLLFVSIGIMLVGVFAVLGAVVYKIRTGDGAPVANGTLAVPTGSTVVDHSIAEGLIALRVRGADGTERILLYSTVDGRRTGEWRIAPMP
jgi:hypothetical protein